MPRMNKAGPDAQGARTGRGLGRCRKAGNETEHFKTLGKGMGRKRHSEDKSIPGKGLRLRYFLRDEKP